jgi:hypothetical protein
MTKDDVLRMAREAGIEFQEHTGITGRVRTTTCGSQPIEKIEALILIARAAEREACAKVCDQKVDAEYATGKVDHNEIGWTQACAIAIRARSKYEQG